MHLSVQDELARLGFPFPITGADHSEEQKTEEGGKQKETAEDAKKKVEFTDEQAAEARRLSQKAAKEAADKARAEERAKIDAERKKADEEAQRKADEEKGEFGKVRESLEKERDDATSKLETITTERDALLLLVKQDVEASWKDLPEEVREAYDGDDDDVLTKKRHMTKNAKIIARLTDKKSPRGNGFDPKATERTTSTDEDSRAKAATRPNF
jgi:hypothetical protein